MTVSTTKAEQVHTGNGAATSFATNFKLLEASHLVVKIRVIATGVETTKVLDTDYSVSNLNNDAGATVTYPLSGSPLPSTEQIILIREVPFTQTTSVKNQSGFFPAVLENAYDLTVMMAQQVKDKTERSLRFAIGSTFNAELPALGGNRTLVTNSGGTAFVQGPTITEISNAEANALAAAASASDAADSAAEAATFDPDNFQPINATLTSIATRGSTANKGLYTTGENTWAEMNVTAAGRALLDDANAAAQRTTLGLGTAATVDVIDEDDMATDSATRPPSQQSVKAYVDSAVIPDAGAVGSTVLARGSADVAFGGTTAGSNLTPTSVFWGLPLDAQGQSFPVGSALSGTWRCLGEYTHNFSNGGNNQGATLWQRIA